MHLKKFFVASLFATVALMFTGTAHAQPSFGLENVEATPVEIDGETWIQNRVTLDFTGALTGIQAWTEGLNPGDMFQETSFGGDVAPNGALFAVEPSVEHDSFVTNGGWTQAEMNGAPLIVGSAVNIGGAPADSFLDDSGINLTWATPPGNAPTDQTSYPVAQFTLSPNANGTLHLFASAGGTPASFPTPIINGVIGIPEPSTVVLLGIGGLMGLVALRRRNR